MNKKCTKCNSSKDISNFYKDKHNKDGYNYRCKFCVNQGNTCSECGKSITKRSKYCDRCCKIGVKNPDWKGGRVVRGSGYVRVKMRDHPNAHVDGYVFEHVMIMSKMIGRPLLKKETVHHKNGIKNDNRLENLELWSSDHPSGQRVKDLVKWAKEILRKYGDRCD